MDELIKFLRKRGLLESQLQKMIDEKIDPAALLLMDDQTLKTFIPLFGDRLETVAFCRTQSTPDTSSSVSQRIISDVVDRLSNKIKKRRRRAPGYVDAEKPSTSHDTSTINAKLNTRRVEIGWMDFDDNKMSFRQVRSQCGGGTRHEQFDKCAKVDITLPRAKELFFPGGVSTKGKMSDFRFALKDFRMIDVGLKTISDLYEETKVKLLRLYMCTTTLEKGGIAIDDDESIDLTDSNADDTWEPPQCLSIRPTTGQVESGSSSTEAEQLPDITVIPSDEEDGPDITPPGDDWLPALPADADTGTPTVRFNLSLRKKLRKPAALGKRETLSETLQRLETKVNTVSKNLINVDRENVIDGGFRGFARPSFDPWNKLSVRFVDEDGIDEGGPMREFMRLALIAVKDLPIFSGANEKMIVLDYNGMNRNMYYQAGQMIAYSIVHRGPLPRFFCPLLFQMLANGIENVTPTVYDITDYDLRSQVEEIADCTTSETFRDAVAKLGDIISLAGCSNLTIQYSPHHQQQLVKALTQFVTVDRLRPAFEQFIRGLQSMGLVDEIEANEDTWKDVFLYPGTSTLDATQIDLLFTVLWSEEGSNRRKEERKTLSYWRDLLQDLADGVVGPITCRDMDLRDVLVFATGAESVPPLGFNPSPTIGFIHPGEVQAAYMAGMPTSNTCAMELKLPVVSCFDDFKANMLASLEMVTTFTAQ